MTDVEHPPDPLVERFQAVGESKFSDVSGNGPHLPTYDAACDYGEHLLRVGNWVSFRVEKSYALTRSDQRHTPDAQCQWRFDDTYQAPFRCRLSSTHTGRRHEALSVHWTEDSFGAIPPPKD